MDARVWLVVGIVAGVSASQVPTSAHGQEAEIPPVVVTRLQPTTPSLQTFEPVKRRALPASERLSVAVINQPTLQSLSEPTQQSLSEPAVRVVKSPTLRSLPEAQAQHETLAAPSFRSLMQPAPQPAIQPAIQPDVDALAEPAVQPAEQRSIKAQFPTIRRRVIPTKAELATEPKPERSAQRSARRMNRVTPDQPSADPVPESNAPVVITTAAIRL
ncbi:MAG: hypothetical protein RI963_3537 [Planctomycetota bacterium]|jgi:hypothetical protein